MQGRIAALTLMLSLLTSCARSTSPAVGTTTVPAKNDADRAAVVPGARVLQEVSPLAPASGFSPDAASSSPAALRNLAPRRDAVVLGEFPCPGCITRLPPSKDAAQPSPLLVVLHGDNGNTAWMDWMWHAATDKHGVVLVVLRCPGAGGYGDPSWSRWQRSASHDPGWIASRLEEVIVREPIDRHKLYASGYSSGATYLSWMVAEHPAAFAAVSLVGGGNHHAAGCSPCKVPVHFLIGSQDTMLQPDALPLRDWYRSCGGHDVVWDERQGKTHEGIQWSLERGGADAILTWMLGHEAGCGV